MNSEHDPSIAFELFKAGRTPVGTEEMADETRHFDLPEDVVAVIPLRQLVLFPGMIAPISLVRRGSIAAATEALNSERPVGLLLQLDAQNDAPDAAQLHQIGTLARVLRQVTTDDASSYVVCQSERRFRATDFVSGYPFLAVRVHALPGDPESTPEIEARLLQLRTRTSEIIALLPQLPEELASAAEELESASALADFAAGLIDLSVEQKQRILATEALVPRLDLVISLLARRIEVLRLSQQITAQTKERIEDQQREFLLREQMKTIQSELGEAGGPEGLLRELGEALARADMPAEVFGQVRKELTRLERMPEASSEHAMLLSWLETVAELPWSRLSEARIDIAHARRILDEDHFGLQMVKRRILEHLAVRKLNPNGKSPILCFVGPPGVGKTSLGQSIARAIGRPFARISLGGVHDESEIRGHRRTYVGALPGNIIQALRKAGTRNGVLMLDEMDKLGHGAHGDPAAALLEVLDPAQNGSFRDHYIGQPFDLSQVMFIATANMLEAISPPLLDRMEIIRLPGYTDEEKLQIARRHLVPRQCEAAGLDNGQCELAGDALLAIVRDYTREAGVRNLEREIGKVYRHAAVRIAEAGREVARKMRIRVTAADLVPILGARKFESELALRTSVCGVATGLAWTPVGGDILFIEASLAPGTGKLILTGQLGDVMKESAQAAMTLLKSQSAELGIGAQVFDKKDIHVHVPAGAMPKDGPSAGVAIHVALVSLLRKTPVRHDVAMTGEISLRGLVLPVGGIKEKVLAALRVGIRTVLLPARNRKDLDDIPEQARASLEFIWLEHVQDALDIAIEAQE